MKPSRRPSTPVNLSDPVQRRLNMYALAAGAAGVGVLAMAQPAEATIVYTRSQIFINVNGGIVHLDLNHDGINDFQFSDSSANWGSGSFGRLVVQPAGQSNGVVLNKTSNCHGYPCASALRRGRAIGPFRQFGGTVMAFHLWQKSISETFGPWPRVTDAYLGLKFIINGNVHFGWARVHMRNNYHIFPAEITGYAYETVPNKPIIAGATRGPDAPSPRPASLGHLAAGASAIRAWRVGK